MLNVNVYEIPIRTPRAKVGGASVRCRHVVMFSLTVKQQQSNFPSEVGTQHHLILNTTNYYLPLILNGWML